MNSNTRCSLPFALKLSRKDTRFVWCRVCTTSSSLAAVRLTCERLSGCCRGEAADRSGGKRSIVGNYEAYEVVLDLPSPHPLTP